MAKVWHSGERVSEHFIIDEFRCHGAECADRINVGNGIDPDLIIKLEALRTLINRPINLTCAYRCPVHNANEGGEETSLHRKGMAADIWVDGLSVESLAAAAVVIGFVGIGQYPDQNFVHVSVGREGRWIKYKEKDYMKFHVDPKLVEYWQNVLNGNNSVDTLNSKGISIEDLAKEQRELRRMKREREKSAEQTATEKSVADASKLPESQSSNGTDVSNLPTLSNMRLEMSNWMKNGLQDTTEQQTAPKFNLWLDGKLLNPDHVIIEAGPPKSTGGFRVSNFDVYTPKVD